MITTFTSTGFKLYRHPDLIGSWRDGRPIPQSLQVALTEKCNLSCKFCSVRNREGGLEFNYDDLISATEEFIKLGAKTVEITGGGEPTCYPHLSNYVRYLNHKGMKIGLITNGIALCFVLTVSDLAMLDWIRISANVYDYVKRISIPEFDGTLGFSYVWTKGISTIQTLMDIKQIAIDANVEYVRLIPDCTGDIDEQNKYLRGIAEELGPPIFLQEKKFRAPDKCYWGYLKPFLYPDGYVYPCSSMVLNPDAHNKFDECYRVCHWSQVKKVWNQPVKSLADTNKCTRCVFTQQNELLGYALATQRHEDFI